MSAPTVPRWDPVRRILWAGRTRVKQYRTPAANQVAVLNAFQEEGWPSRIDDPLPPANGHDPKRRLHETIHSLNRNRKSRILRFTGDGTGRGIFWEILPSRRRRL